MSRIKDISGKKYGKLIVIKFHSWYKYSNRQNSSKWLCQCECGNKCIVTINNLSQKQTKSCGCLHKQIMGKYGIKKTRKETAIKTLYKRYKDGSIVRNYNFDISYNEFKKIISKNCYYCGVIPNKEFLNRNKNILPDNKIIYNGIDRVNNKLGYNINNIVPCCEICNKMKLTMTQEDFILHIRKIFSINKLELIQEEI